jgi:hypothetical protein
MDSSKEIKKRIQFVYKTTNLLNGTYYIGVHSTWNIDDGYLGSGKRLIRSIKKYGKENFKREILKVFSNYQDALNYESYLVNESLLEDELCLNLKPGGSGGFCNNEHKEKFIESLKNSQEYASKKGREKILWLLENDIEWKTKYSNNIKEGLKKSNFDFCTFKGKKHTEESKQKIRESMKGKGSSESNSQFGTRWITNGIQNKKINKEESIPEGWILGRKLNFT